MAMATIGLGRLIGGPSTAEPGLLGIRWHGRGGTGAKTGAVLLAELGIAGGYFGQALPEFGPERRGAPVAAFTRLSDHRIAQRGPIGRPDVLVVLDASLLDSPSVLRGVDGNTLVFVNAPGDARAEVEAKVPGRLVTVDASAASRGALGRDLPNIPMLAAVVGGLDLLPRDEFLRWLEDRLSREFRAEIVAGNLAATRSVLAALAGRPTPTPLRTTDGTAVPPRRFSPDGAGSETAPPPAEAPGAVLRWQDALPGPYMPAGGSRQFTTGDWRQERPVLDLEKCVHCMLCWLYCPDSAIGAAGGRITSIDLTYCKGCGICAEVCPPKYHAIVMVGEDA
jgi:pyruvate ferredoxin oxidoreductase gamma subunit